MVIKVCQFFSLSCNLFCEMSFFCYRFSTEKIWYIDQMLKVLSEVCIIVLASILLVFWDRCFRLPLLFCPYVPSVPYCWYSIPFWVCPKMYVSCLKSQCIKFVSFQNCPLISNHNHDQDQILHVRFK